LRKLIRWLPPLLATAPALAAEAPPVPAEEQAPIVVYGRGIEQIGVALSASQGTVGYADFEDRPISRTGELVENVPGVIATQHSGTGKANQYFLRGFNLDHGTDFAGFVDGVPINMRTHGHGQGYLDFNFLIPELVERIDYRKGPYFADVGDFSAAGTVAFKTWDSLPESFVQADIGEFGYYRGVAALSVKAGGGDLLIGAEGVASNGPWVKDENLEKVNGFLKWSKIEGDRGVRLSLSAYDASWDSTDQVPERAIKDGTIDRFGFIDDDLGGATTRVALGAEGLFGATQANVYALHYRLRLTSNFTYFLDDPVNGDQFRQEDKRAVVGGAVRHQIDSKLGAMPLAIRFGADGRYDIIDRVGLYRSIGGEKSATVREDSVDEWSLGLWGEGTLTPAPGLRVTLGLRGDVIAYDVRSDEPLNSGDGADAFIAPKAAIAWAVSEKAELYANYGESFHSNDVRGATITIDPVSGEPTDRVQVFARGRGAEFGGRVETGRLNFSAAAFWLHLESELVFVGDAGTTEPNDATRRYGIETTAFWRPTDWLTVDASAAWTDAKFSDLPDGEDDIPGAVRTVVGAGVAAEFGRGFSGSVRVRHFGSAPLIEDGSMRSDPTTLANLGAYWRRGPVRIGIDVLNLFDAKDADITYVYESRLADEAEPVADRHLHPVEPRQVRGTVRLSF